MISEKTAIAKPSLEAVLAYENEDVIARFTDLFFISEEEAVDIFRETRKFLFICRRPGVFIPDDLLIIDEMWHNFILFTKEYQRFCEEQFGAYIHHLPASKQEKREQARRNSADPKGAHEEFQGKLQDLLSTTYDLLGEETLIKWFQTYPAQYSSKTIHAIRKH